MAISESFEIRPFEKCIERVKYTTKVASQDFKESGLYPIISQEEAFISGYWDSSEDVFHISKPVVIFGDHSRHLKYIDFDFVIGADGVKILCPVDDINAKYFYYYLRWLDIPSLGYSRHFKSLKEKTVKVFPIDVQQRIVDELDLLTGIIDKKNAQLRDLDNLAQSIFYEMFGDPVINDKGWETMVLSSVSQLLNGRAYKQDELLDSGKYKVIRVGNFFTNSEFYYSDLELEDDKYCDYGDLLFAWSASFGAFIWSGEKVIYHYHIWKVLFDENKLDKVFYQYLLNTMTSSFMKDVHGIGMVHLTKSGMEQYVLPIPPLDVQKSFAERISAIESQKSSINESLIATQTLLDSRMNAYFNC